MPETSVGGGPAVRIAIDIGGTFTDLVLEHADGRLVSHKRLTTPKDPVDGFVAGIAELLDKASAAGGDISEILHATTLGSNVVIERKGQPVGFLTTRGFGDLLDIQKAVRYSIYDTHMDKPRPLVPRRRVWEIGERMAVDGSVVAPLLESDVRAAVAAAQAAGVAALAVGFLHAYANPAHERRAAEIVRELAPGLPVTLSSEVSQLAKEYARFSTTVLNAYLTPVFRDYLSRLEGRLTGIGVRAPIRIMQSSGGLTTKERAQALPVRSIESGPAAGVVMAARCSRLAGSPDVISFDMGGTTAKASIVRDGKPTIARSFELDRVQMRNGSGLPVDTLAVDLIEIGAGGGSIAEVKAGVLQVGPRSAGSEPGPVCYGRGGREPTVTDAALVLGYLDASAFAGGTMPLDKPSAEAAIARLGERLGLDMLTTAWGIHRLVVLSMERAGRLISIDKGLDPRRFAMICFGGAGPVHGARLARGLGVARMIVPVDASVGSALGLLEADEAVELARTRILPLAGPGLAAAAQETLAELDQKARELLDLLGGDAYEQRITLGLRYKGQGHEIEIPVRSARAAADAVGLAEQFAERYRMIYGYTESIDVEVATWRLAASRPRRQRLDRSGVHSGGPGTAKPTARATRRRRLAHFGDGMVEAAVYQRSALATGERVTGPAMIEERDTTTVLLPGDTACVDSTGALIVEIAGGGRP